MEIGHEKAGHEKGSDHLVALDALDVLFDFGFAIKVEDMLERALGHFADMRQTGPDKMLDPVFKARVSNVLALLDLDVFAQRLPEVRDGKDGVAAFDGGIQGGAIVEVSLGQLNSM